MSQHLSRRRLIAGGLAGAGFAAVPVLGASEALATGICDTPPEAGLWRNESTVALARPYHVSRAQLRFECGARAPKSGEPGQWYVTVWLTGPSLNVASGERDHMIGEVRAQRSRPRSWITAIIEDRDATYRFQALTFGAGAVCPGPERLITRLTPLRFGRVRGTGSLISDGLLRPACLDHHESKRLGLGPKTAR